jgi:hypothetical protein
MKFVIYRKENSNKITIETLDDSHSVNDVIRKCEEYFNNGIIDVRWCRQYSTFAVDEYGYVIKEMDGFPVSDVKMSWFDYITMPFYRFAWFVQSLFIRFKRACNRFMNSFDPIESYNINIYLFDFLIKNAQALKNNLSSVANYALEVAIADGTDKTYDPSQNYDDECMEKAKNIYIADLDRLILNCRLALFYDNCDDTMYIDDNNKELFQIPYFAFSDTEIDYMEMSRRRQVASDEVFDYLKDHIHELWD